jgi:protein CpxP
MKFNIKILTILVVILILINTLLVFILVFKPKHKMPREIIIEKLQFDDNQVKKYDLTIINHRKNIKNMDDSIRITKNEMYKLLNYSKIDNQKKDSLSQKIANFQKQIESIHFNHFLEIKKLCKKEQLNDFNNLTKELSKLFSQRPKPRHE